MLIIPCTLNTAPAVPCLDLPPLDAEEGALFILRQAGLLSSAATLDQVPDEQRPLTLALARELQGLPLALKLAGRYLKETGCSIQNYLFSYRDYPAQPCQPDNSESEETEVIEVTCGLTLAHLAQKWPGALELLSLCALLSPDAIPVAQAKRCYQRVLPAYERVLGKAHPETLRCQEEAASIRPSTKEGQHVSDPASKL